MELKDLPQLIQSKPEGYFSGSVLDHVLALFEGTEDPPSFTNDISLKLTRIMVLCGLMPVIDDSVNGASEYAMKTAERCLGVIDKMASGSPSTLISSFQAENGSTLVYKWLFPRIATLCCSYNSDVAKKAIGTLKRSIASAALYPDTWSDSSNMCSFLLSQAYLLTQQSYDSLIYDSNIYYSLNTVDKITVSMSIVNAVVGANISRLYLIWDNSVQRILTNVLKGYLDCITGYKLVPETFETIHLLLVKIIIDLIDTFERAEGWFKIGLQYLKAWHTKLPEISSGSNLDLSIAEMVLRMSLYLTKNRHCARNEILPKLSPGGNSNIGLAWELFETSFDSKDYSSVKDIFQSPQLEEIRLEILRMSSMTATSGTHASQYLISGDFAPLSSININDIKQFVANDFQSLPNSIKIRVMERIGKAGCYLAHDIVPDTDICQKCKGTVAILLPDRPLDIGFDEIFTLVIRSADFQENLDLRLATLNSLYSVYVSYRCTSKFDPFIELYGWILASLKSSSRVIRIAAGRLLPCFVVDSSYGSINSDELLRSLSAIRVDQQHFLVESTILAWGCLSRLLDGERLNFILMKLIDILGSSNAFHSSLASRQFEEMARYKNLTVYQLCSPFWNTISVRVVKQLDDNKMLVSKFVNLLGIEQDEFLRRTVSFTVPYLILSKRQDIIASIAEAFGYTKTLKLYLDHIPVILAGLLIQNVEDPPKFAMKRWLELDESFHNVEFSVVIAPNVLELTYEILKMYHGDPLTSAKNVRIIKALEFVASVKYGDNWTLPGLFNHNLVLQLVAKFSDTVRNTRGMTTVTTKMQSIMGLTMMLKISGYPLYHAVPQICTFLQSALDSPPLQTAAIEAWHAMLVSIGKEVSTIIDLTFAVIVQNWAVLVPEARLSAHRMVEEVIYQYGGVIKDKSAESGITSLTGIPEFEGLESMVRNLNVYDNDRTAFEKLELILQRCDNDNIYMVRQTLLEIRSLLLNNQDEIYSGLKDTTNLGKLSSLLSTLMTEIRTFRNIRGTDIPQLGVQSLGLLGAIDHHKLDLKRPEEDMIVVYNFKELKESVNFVILLLQQYLIRSFRASTNPSLQMFLAYGMQEHAKFCGFSTTRSSEEWNSLDFVSKSILLPLLTSKYTAPLALPYKINGSVFGQGMSHSEWLSQCCNCLMSNVSGTNAIKIFGVCRKMVREDDYEFHRLFEHLLPYVALNVVVSDNETAKTWLQEEIMEVLKYEPKPDNLVHLDMVPFYRSIFHLLDYFSRWMRARKEALHNKQGARHGKDLEILEVENFLSAISPELMALRSYQSRSYPRAVLYWEQYLRALQDKDVEVKRTIFDRFRNIYASLDDVDSLQGIFAKISEMSFETLKPSLEHHILEYESNKQWDFALECYKVKNLDQWDIPGQTDMMKCLREGGNYDTILTQLKSLEVLRVQDSKSWPEEWSSLGCEVSWLSGDWNSLDYWLRRSPDNTFAVSVGKALIALRDGKPTELEYWVNASRGIIARELSSTHVTSISQCYDAVIQSHLLSDLESISTLAFDHKDDDHIVLSKRLDCRLESTGISFDTRKDILALRRIAIEAGHFPFARNEIGLTWITSAKDARKRGQFNLALKAGLQARSTDNPNVDIEYAKLQWQRGDRHKAIHALEVVLDPRFVQINADRANAYAKGDFTRDQARAALLYTKWRDDAGSDDSDVIIRRYEAIVRGHSGWDKVHYRFAKYCNKLYDSQAKLPDEMRGFLFTSGYLVTIMVQNYSRCVQLGFKYVYEVVPKLMTIWLDFSEQVTGSNKKETKKGTTPFDNKKDVWLGILTNITRLIKRWVNRFPLYASYLALPQLLSRIVHPDTSVYEVMREIVVAVALKYPSQSLWYILPVSLSSSRSRRDRGQSIIKILKGQSSKINNELTSVITSSERLVVALRDLCHAPIAQQRKRETYLRDLNFNSALLPCPLVVPVQAMLEVTLPTAFDGTPDSYEPFGRQATITSIEQTVVIQSSLQKPKRITIWGSNGLRYHILCKPKDDVRKDARLMEFTSSIDKLLVRDKTASLRHLRIKTYHVTPLNEECGLIEWVDDATPMRGIVTDIMNTKGIRWNTELMKEKLNKLEVPDKVEGFRELLRMYPPLLHEWFVATFPDPSVWLESRSRFARSSAVMSIVGYILGLGDRHGENILLLGKTGAVLHVDFDCLFDKATNLDIPERVPFRLTHSMVDAFGPTGYEGLFRRSCEVTLELLRANEDTLMTILETFIHDPIVEWLYRGKKKNSGQPKIINGVSAARSPEEALESIRNKIRGIKYQESLPLSVPGQVEYLIKQAVSDVNLAQMYIGWLPFM